jgi:outer membrane protein insertion porin family
MLGAGFSSSEKLVLSGSISQDNLFGSGNQVGIQVSTSKSNKVYSLSHTNPYYTEDGISRGFDVYTRNSDTSSLSVGSFGADSMGGGVRFGVPITEDQSIHLGLSVDRTTLKVDPTYSPARYVAYVNQYGAESKTLLSTFGWADDKRDSIIYPTKGVYQRAVLEVALPGSTATYYRSSYQYQRFFPLDRKWTLMLNGELNGAMGYGNKELPFFKNYYAGGIGSVRGYDSASLGPKDEDPTSSAYGSVLGGNSRMVGNAELFFPMPGAGLDKSVRLSAFIDAGNVWDSKSNKYRFNLGSLRYSSGVALSWNSPVGPLKFSLAKPISKQADDKTQMLQFQLGSVF